MNQTSNGSLPRRDLTVRAGLAAALFGSFAATMAGCPGPEPMHIKGTGGTGGGTPSSTSATSTSATTSSTDSTSTGGVQCMGPDGCPKPSNPCEQAACVNNQCTKQPADARTPCSDSGALCDGAGNCVQCLTETDCKDPNAPFCNGARSCVQCLTETDCKNPVSTPCTGSIYTAPPTCDSGMCVPALPQDCAAMHLACKSTGCTPCTGALDCVSGTVNTQGCVTPTCNGGMCGKDIHPLGSTCTQMGATSPGTCNATGACVNGKYVFVTSGTFAATLGGIDQMDGKCQEAATNAGFVGMWLSWTSDLQKSPALRFMKSTQPYLKLDDTPVAMDWTGLTSGTLMSGIDIAQNHQLLQGVPVWTGTTPSGDPSGSCCGSWSPSGATLTGTAGVSGKNDNQWTQVLDKPCGNMEHLYCFQQ